MLTLPLELAARLNGRTTSITVCWAVTRRDGGVLRGTAHQRNISIASGIFAGSYPARATIYQTDVVSKSDGSVTNSEVEGAFFSQVDEISVADIEAGLFDQAPADLFLVDWRMPNAGQKVLVSGTLGEFYRDADGRYRSELRGLTQALKQGIVATYSERCDVKQFGDSRCKFNVAAVTRSGTVSNVVNRKRITVALDPGSAPPSAVYFVGGHLRFTTGPLSNVVREVKACIVNETNDSAEIALWDEAPADIDIGAEISLSPGCDRMADTCRLIHENLVNFRGHGRFAVGRDALMRGPSNFGNVIQIEGQYLTREEFQAVLAAIDQGTFFA